MQWAVRYGVDLYLVPPSGNDMGKFSVSTFKQIARMYLESGDKTGYFKKMLDSEMFKEGGAGDPYYSPDAVRNAIRKLLF